MVRMAAVLLVIVMPVHAAGQDSFPEPFAGGSRKITGIELRQAGVMRLSDILRYIDEWDVMTVDGYRCQVSAGLSGYQGQNWDIMLDGQRMELNVLGSQNINMLPVTTDLIDYVEVINEPGLYEGFFVEEGLLHIHTIEPEHGGSFRLRYTVGNETGDPGPNKYTSENTPNIDKIGPDNSASVSLKDDSFWVRLNYKYENHASTDPVIEKRSRYYSWDDRQVRMVMPSIQIETDALPGYHRFFAAGAMNGAQTDIFTIPPKTFYRSDLLFVGQNADELPVLTNYFHSGANGTVPLTPAADFVYRATWSSQNVYSPSFRGTPDPSFYSSVVSVNPEIRYQNGSALYSLGCGFERRHVQTEYTLTGRPFSAGSFHLSAELPVTGTVRQKIGMNMIFHGSDAALKNQGTTYWSINEQNDLDLSFSISQRLFGEQNSLWFWRDRGYLFFVDYAGDIEVNGAFDTSQTIASRLSWRFRPRKTLETTTALLFRSYNALALVKNDYVPAGSSSHLEAETVVDADAQGQTYGIECRSSHNPAGNFSHTLYVRCRMGVNGDKTFKDEQNTLPGYTLSYSGKLTMRHNISIHGRLCVISETEWSDFRAVSNASNGLYKSRLSRQVVADLAVEKWFGHRTVRTMLQLRNLFNHRVQYYPAGALFDMSVYVQVELLLDSLWQL